MNKVVNRMLVKSLVKPFYRQNAGQFVFIFILFFGAVGEIGGKAQYTGPILQLEYQYALILGMLRAPVLFSAVLFAWLFYNEKCANYILKKLNSPEYACLELLNRLDTKNLFRKLLLIQALLFLPISLYSVAILTIACYNHCFFSAFFVFGYIILLCIYNAKRFQYCCQHPGVSVTRGKISRFMQNLLVRFSRDFFYWPFYIRYGLKEQKLLLTGIKLFSCGVIYLAMKTLTENDYELRMPVLFFSIGLLGHGILIYRWRELEDTMLLFYRGLPVSLIQRVCYCAILYFVLLVPELITFCFLIPQPLHGKDALMLFFFGWGTLLLLNSWLYIKPIQFGDYFKMLFCLFLLMYFCVLGGMLAELVCLLPVMAVTIFMKSYYSYDSGDIPEK